MCPVFILRIPETEGEYGVGQAPPVTLRGTNADEDGTIATSLKATLLHFHASCSCSTGGPHEQRLLRWA
jgi:hypothetical protein